MTVRPAAYDMADYDEEAPMKGQEKPKKLGKKVAQKSLKEKRAEKKAKKSGGGSSF